MDGYGTLIWNRIVRIHHPDGASPRDRHGATDLQEADSQKPLTPEFADDPDHIEVRLLT